MNIEHNRAVTAFKNERRFAVWGGINCTEKRSPVDAAGYPLKANCDPKTFLTVAECNAIIKRGAAQGISIHASNSEEIYGTLTPLTIIDLDDCIDNGGELSDFAQQMVTAANTYTAYSVSGTGLHMYLRGTILNQQNEPKTKPSFEIYSKKKPLRCGTKSFNDLEIATLDDERLSRIIALLPAKRTKPERQLTAQSDADEGGDDVTNEMQRILSLLSAEQREYFLNADATDAGNADCMKIIYGDKYRWNETIQEFLEWRGGRWCIDDKRQARRDARITLLIREQLTLEKRNATEDDKAKKILSDTIRILKKAQNSAPMRAFLDSFASLLDVTTAQRQYNQNDFILCVGDQTIDLKTNAVRRSAQCDMNTRSTGTGFNAGASCPRWLKFLDEIFSSNAETVGYIQRLFGYLLTGLTREHEAYFFIGAGANGKSVMLSVMQKMLGEYGMTTNFAAFEDASSEGKYALASMEGARLVVISETPESGQLNEARIKAVTGGDIIRARQIYTKGFEYTPKFKIVLATNHEPVIRGNDDGIWRRVRVIKFQQQFLEARADKNLTESLYGEIQGILNWALHGLADYWRHGLTPPSAVVNATATYRSENDVLGQWIEERTYPCSALSNRVEIGAAYTSYRDWCTSGNYKPYAIQNFSKNLVGRKLPDNETQRIEKQRSNGKTFLVGLSMTK